MFQRLINRILRRIVPSETALQAARWWAVRLDGPFSPSESFASRCPVLGFYAERELQVTDAQRELFTQALAKVIERGLRDRWSRLIGVTVSVDYHPDDAIYEALEAAGLSTDDYAWNLPWKTRMRVKAGEVTVSRDFGPEELVWSAAASSPAAAPALV
jgi:hypothetical protein